MKTLLNRGFFFPNIHSLLTLERQIRAKSQNMFLSYLSESSFETTYMQGSSGKL